jgi:hypothetical protein
VKTGYVSDAVTLYAKFGGVVTARPLAVQAEMISGPASVTVTGTLTDGALPVTFPVLDSLSEVDGQPFYTGTNGAITASLGYSAELESYRLIYDPGPGANSVWVSFDEVPTDYDALSLSPSSPATGTPVITLSPGGSALQLTCETPASTIRYTTDGSYPSPAATLYTAPISGLSGGMLIRAAAYVTGMPPSDVIDIPLTE